MNVDDVLNRVPAWSSSPPEALVAHAVADGELTLDQGAAHAGVAPDEYLKSDVYQYVAGLRRVNNLAVATDREIAAWEARQAADADGS
jgi:hypothetical protein